MSLHHTPMFPRKQHDADPSDTHIDLATRRRMEAVILVLLGALAAIVVGGLVRLLLL